MYIILSFSFLHNSQAQKRTPKVSPERLPHVLYYFKHILPHRLLAVGLVHFFSRLFQFFHANHLILRIVQSQMSVGIHRNSDIGMSHQILERLWIHTSLCLVTAVSMSANVRRDLRHLHFENAVVSIDRMFESMFPMQRHLRYGDSVGSLKSMGALDIGISEEELQPLVNTWRRTS